MTNLTDKWKKGELANDTYYVRLNHDSSTTDVYDCGVWWSEAWHEITEVLAPVPSYEEYIAMKKLISSKIDTRNNQDRLLAENTKLKELLKKCRDILLVDEMNATAHYKKALQGLLTKINQVLGEE